MIIQHRIGAAGHAHQYINLGYANSWVNVISVTIPSFIDLGAAAGAFIPNISLGAAAGKYESNLSLGAAAGKRTPNIDLGGSWLADD